jgi:uncharacterized protein YqeY
MKARDKRAVVTLRSALAAIDNAEAVEVAQAPSAGGGRPAGEGEIAGAVLGVGAAEVERRTLTAAEMEALLRREAAERQTAAHEYERAGQAAHAERLRAEAELLGAYLDGDA